MKGAQWKASAGHSHLITGGEAEHTRPNRTLYARIHGIPRAGYPMFSRVAPLYVRVLLSKSGYIAMENGLAQKTSLLPGLCCQQT